MIKIKVCGMRDHANIEAVASLQPDFMGFIFYRKSKRFVGDSFIMPTLSPSIHNVGIFVNEPTAWIKETANRNAIKHIQLHGNETPSQCEALKNEGFFIIKAFSIASDFNFKDMIPYKSVVDYFLFDTKGDNYGGNGKTFNWEVLTKYDQQVPFFLSGGISLANAESAWNLKNMNIYALDVNSRFEVEPGLKDIPQLNKLFELRGKNSIVSSTN
jgi:phosphoribosylanthranilate isomerase